MTLPNESDLFTEACKNNKLDTDDLPGLSKWRYNRTWIANKLRQFRKTHNRKDVLALLDEIKPLINQK